MTREIGTVSDWRHTHGFIKPARAGDEEVFVHFSAIEGSGYRSLRVGERVAYERVAGPKGPRAEAVRVLDKAEIV